MRPVTCCDQICGFRKEAVHPPFCFPSCLAFVEHCFLLLSVFVCVWTQDMVMVGMRDGLEYSRDPLEEWTHNFALPLLWGAIGHSNILKKYGSGSSAVWSIDMHRASYVWIQIAPHQLFNGHCLNVSISTRICEAKQRKMCAVCIVRGSGRVGLSRCKWIFEVRAVCRPPGLLSRSCSAFPSHQSSQVSQSVQIYLCTPTLWTEISFSKPLVYLGS